MTGFILRRVWEPLFGEAVRRVEREAAEYSASDAGKRPDWKTMTVLVVAAAALTVHSFTGSPIAVAKPVGWVVGLFSAEGGRAATAGLEDWGTDPFGHYLWWVGSCLFAYVVIPVPVIWFGFRERVREYGTKLTGVLAGWPIYLAFVAVMVPLVYLFSAEPHFQDTYPFYTPEPTDEGRLWKRIAWELAYAVQFVGLEFFFRGFVLHGTKHRFGVYAVFVMTVPYTMIHFHGKPLPECCAAIVAGIALGLMSLKTRSVWLGAALHISVAWGMDFCSLARKGLMGG